MVDFIANFLRDILFLDVVLLCREIICSLISVSFSSYGGRRQKLFSSRLIKQAEKKHLMRGDKRKSRKCDIVTISRRYVYSLSLCQFVEWHVLMGFFFLNLTFWLSCFSRLTNYLECHVCHLRSIGVAPPPVEVVISLLSFVLFEYA